MNSPNTKMALPKGRMQDSLFRLLRDAGIDCRSDSRSYRLSGFLPGYTCKILKPANIVEMLHGGTRDVGFAGADLVAEIDADLVEVLDLGLDPVRIVAAAPESILVDGSLPTQRLRVASEYQALTRRWIEERNLDATVIRSFGATEVFPPEDADCIVDNVSTGATLKANQLAIVDEVMVSSTRLYSNRTAMDDPLHRERIEQLALLLRSVLAARERVLIEINVPPDCLEAVVSALPCMRQPTVARLHDQTGFAVRAAVPRSDVPALIPKIKACGGTDLLISTLTQIVP
jgi:ATP phosphoribosyltransferase